MRIGYSAWGFLGPGITDTPDGGRSHRKPLIDALIRRGHQIVFLQRDRDRAEAGDDLAGAYHFDATGLPQIDALVFEWRWPIPGRNTTPCGSAGHTCDLHRQDELIDHYTRHQPVPVVLWDKDRQLSEAAALRTQPGVTVCEAALEPTRGAHRLMFPVDDAWIERTDPARLAKLPRPVTLSYIGNQYDRDDAFDRYFAPAARQLQHVVAGKWTRTDRWTDLNFIGRTPFTDVERIYARSLATILLLPDRYAVCGQMTQRLFEAVLAGCLPLAPAQIRGVDQFVPKALIIDDDGAVTAKLADLRAIAGTSAHIDLLEACIERIRKVFGLADQVDALEAAIRASQTTLTEGHRS